MKNSTSKIAADRIVEEMLQLLTDSTELTPEQNADIIKQLQIATDKGSLAAPSILAKAAKGESILAVDPSHLRKYLFMAYKNAKWLCLEENKDLITDFDKSYGINQLYFFAKIHRRGSIASAAMIRFSEDAPISQMLIGNAAIHTQQQGPTIRVNDTLALDTLEIVDQLADDHITYMCGLSRYYRGEFGERYKDLTQLANIQQRLQRLQARGQITDVFQLNEAITQNEAMLDPQSHQQIAIPLGLLRWCNVI